MFVEYIQGHTNHKFWIFEVKCVKKSERFFCVTEITYLR